MSNRRVAVLGGGVGGLAGAVLRRGGALLGLADQLRGLGGGAAELAKKPRIDVVLYERSSALGGLQHSVSIDGASYDIGAFIFTTDHDLFRAFPGLIERFPDGAWVFYRLAVGEPGRQPVVVLQLEIVNVTRDAGDTLLASG